MVGQFFLHIFQELLFPRGALALSARRTSITMVVPIRATRLSVATITTTLLTSFIHHRRVRNEQLIEGEEFAHVVVTSRFFLSLLLGEGDAISKSVSTAGVPLSLSLLRLAHFGAGQLREAQLRTRAGVV